jgi:integrase/recombinase XerD
MADANFATMSLYARQGGRKYLNAAEQRRFLEAAATASAPVRLFCGVLFWGGCRISEALALTADRFDLDAGVVSFETLKRRRRGVIRQVPLPAELVRQLDLAFGLCARQRDPHLVVQRLWPWSRTTAWRHVKRLMAAAAVSEPAAMPKGLRHAFGVTAFQNAVPPHLVQRWLGHASLDTTSIYGDVSGNEEREFAAKVWCGRRDAAPVAARLMQAT